MSIVTKESNLELYNALFEEEIEKTEQEYIEKHTKTIHLFKEEYVKQLQQENKQLKDNWNKLEEWLKEYLYKSPIKFKDWDDDRIEMQLHRRDMVKDVLSKMQEIGGSNEEN